ncbi:MAG: hypothetical protein MUC94_03190 [bacterium]|nr:hypothetical protein [bacterium]
MLVISTNVVAGSFEAKKYEFGISSGVLFTGNVYISLYGDNVKQNSNFLFRGYADAFIIPQLAFGCYFNYSTLNLDEDIEVFGKAIKKSGTPIWEFGGTIKPRFIINERIAIKPGFSVGHRRFAGDNDFSKWKGLALNGSCELQYCLSDKLRLFEETGFLYQPYGGNVDTDVTFDPIVYVVFGVAF